MGWCFLSSTLFSLASTVLTLRIDDQQAGLQCGALACVRPGGADEQSRREAAADAAAAPGAKAEVGGSKGAAAAYAGLGAVVGADKGTSPSAVSGAAETVA